MKNKEQLVRLGSLIEIVKFFNMTGRGINNALKNGTFDKRKI
jgi:hypothetical protein